MTRTTSSRMESHYIDINILSLNKDKSEYMICQKETQTLTLKINKINIEKVDEFNFLG